MRVYEAEKRVYELIVDAVENTGFIPTRRELATNAGYSPVAVRNALRGLEDRGLIEVIPGKPRCIRLNKFSLVPNNQLPAHILRDDVAYYGEVLE